jgi:hypothetical protein
MNSRRASEASFELFFAHSVTVNSGDQGSITVDRGQEKRELTNQQSAPFPLFITHTKNGTLQNDNQTRNRRCVAVNQPTGGSPSDNDLKKPKSFSCKD